MYKRSISSLFPISARLEDIFLHNELKVNLFFFSLQPRKVEPEPSQGSFLTLPLLIILILLAVNHNKVLHNLSYVSVSIPLFSASVTIRETLYSVTYTLQPTKNRCKASFYNGCRKLNSVFTATVVAFCLVRSMTVARTRRKSVQPVSSAGKQATSAKRDCGPIRLPVPSAGKYHATGAKRGKICNWCYKMFWFCF